MKAVDDVARGHGMGFVAHQPVRVPRRRVHELVVQDVEGGPCRRERAFLVVLEQAVRDDHVIGAPAVQALSLRELKGEALHMNEFGIVNEHQIVIDRSLRVEHRRPTGRQGDPAPVLNRDGKGLAVRGGRIPPGRHEHRIA